MSDVMISGVPVKFPNKPYPSQFSMMSKVGQNFAITLTFIYLNLLVLDHPWFTKR